MPKASGVDETCQIMLAEAKVYIMADKFMLAAMKTMSTERFRCAALCAETFPKWKSENFPAIADEVYSSTRRTDLALKAPICRLLHNKRREKELWSSMQPVFRAHGDLATGVLNYWNTGRSQKTLCPSCRNECRRNVTGGCYCDYCRRYHESNYHDHSDTAAVNEDTEVWAQKEVAFMMLEH
jgi:hypothetical protein